MPTGAAAGAGGGEAGLEEGVGDLGEVEAEAVLVGDDLGDLGERDVVVEVGGHGVVDAQVDAQAGGAAAGRIGLGGKERVQQLTQREGARVVDAEGGGLFAGGNAVLVRDEQGDGAGGAGECQRGVGAGGAVGHGVGVASGDAVGGVAGGEHVEVGELAGEAELTLAALDVGLGRACRRCGEVGRETAVKVNGFGHQ